MDFDKIFSAEDGESFEDIINRLIDTFKNLTPEQLEDFDKYLSDNIEKYGSELINLNERSPLNDMVDVRLVMNNKVN